MNDAKALRGAEREQQLRDMNDALLVSSVRQHELVDRAEVAERAARESERHTRDARDFAYAIVRTSPVALLVLESDLRVFLANEAFYKRFEVRPEETEGRLVYELGNGQWDIPKLRTLLEAILPRQSWFEHFEVTHEFEAIGRRTMLLNARRLETRDVELPELTGRIVLVIEDITDRKRAEEALAESEERYRTLFDLGPVAVYSCDVSGVIQDFNHRAAELWGRKPAVGETDERFCGSFRMLRPDGTVMAHEDCPMADVLSGRAAGVSDGEVNIVRPDGSQITVVVNIRPIKNERGEIAGAINCFYDITERKQFEQALRESEEMRRFSQQAAGIGTWTWDKSSGIVRWSRETYDLFGIDPHTTLLYESWRNVLHPEDREPADAAAQQAMQRGENLDVEYRVNHPSRGERWLTSIGRIIDPVQRPGYMTGVSMDITERKRAEEAVARLAAIVTSSEDAIISKNLNGVITTWNKGAEHLFGYTAEEAIGKPVTLLIPDDYLDEEPRILERIRRGEAIEHYETVRRRKDGSLLDISLTVSPLRDGVGRIIGASKIARDITERSRLKKQMQEQAASLSDLHRRKDEFLAMLSHELRNPLAPIANAVQLLRLQRGSENPIEQQARTIIERQVGQLKHLIDDLLEVSRISTGRIHLHQDRVAVSGVVEHAVETVRALIVQRRHALKVSVPPEPIWLYGDAARLEQVMVNLLTNAAKYTEEGGRIWLTVEVRSQEPGVRGQQDRGPHESSSLTPDSRLLTPEAVLRVRDTGVGIAPELLPRIFDLFTQADRSLDRSEGGLGIGLSLVQRLVELHGGTVEVVSALGQGSEFVVRLPLASDEWRAASGEQEGFDPATRHSSLATSLRVLVVDDNVDSAKSLAMVLRAERHEVRTAHDGPSALEAALDYRPDVLLLDIGLPGLNGFEVAKRIRQHPTLQNIVLVAMTGYGQESDRQHSQEAGFDHHLTKPADFSRLQQILASPEGRLTNR